MKAASYTSRKIENKVRIMFLAKIVYGSILSPEINSGDVVLIINKR